MNKHTVQSALRAFCTRTPFRHYLIEFVSGHTLTVTHPEAVRFREDLLVFVSPQKKHRLFDSSSVSQVLDLS